MLFRSMFLAEGGEAPGIADCAGIKQLLLHDGGAGDGVVEAIAQTHGGLTDWACDGISARKQTTWASELKRGTGVLYGVG